MDKISREKANMLSEEKRTTLRSPNARLPLTEDEIKILVIISNI